MNTIKKDTKEFIEQLKEAGVNIKTLNELYENGLDFEIIEKEIGRYLTRKNVKTAICSDLLIINSFILARKKLGHEEAIKHIQSMEEEDKRICKEVSKVGYEISSVWDFVNSPDNYPEALPVLVKLLPKISNPKTKEGIVRALTYRDSGIEVKEALVSEYRKFRIISKNDYIESLRFTLGNALSVLCKKDDAKMILEFVGDSNYGRSRHMLFHYLAKFKIRESEETLIKLLEEDDIVIVNFAIDTLGKLKTENAKKHIMRFKNHPNPKTREFVAKNLKRLEKK